MKNFLLGLENFRLELLGEVSTSSYLAWIILSLIGAVVATLIRNHLTTLKSFPVNAVQLLTVILITFVFVRFSLELTGLTPSAFGAFAIGLGGNEIALGLLKRFLEKKKLETSADGPGGSNPPPDPDDPDDK